MKEVSVPSWPPVGYKSFINLALINFSENQLGGRD